jgi:para-nitrobenzyl esterase
VLGDKVAGAFEFESQAYAELDPRYCVSALMTDRMFGTGSNIMAERRAKQGGAATYAYRVDFYPPVAGGMLRAPHGTEVPLMFGPKVPAAFVVEGRAVDMLSDRLITAWLYFARSSSPSQTDLEWPAYGNEHGHTMIFDASSRVAHHPGKRKLEFWIQWTG